MSKTQNCYTSVLKLSHICVADPAVVVCVFLGGWEDAIELDNEDATKLDNNLFDVTFSGFCALALIFLFFWDIFIVTAVAADTAAFIAVVWCYWRGGGEDAFKLDINLFEVMFWVFVILLHFFSLLLEYVHHHCCCCCCFCFCCYLCCCCCFIVWEDNKMQLKLILICSK